MFARGSIASIEQILDVLVDRALHHGRDAIAVTLRRIAGGGAEAEGGCLMVTRPEPTTFSLILVNPDENPDRWPFRG